MFSSNRHSLSIFSTFLNKFSSLLSKSISLGQSAFLDPNNKLAGVKSVCRGGCCYSPSGWRILWSHHHHRCVCRTIQEPWVGGIEETPGHIEIVQIGHAAPPLVCRTLCRQQDHHLWADIVEGDGQVTAAVHACKIEGSALYLVFFTYPDDSCWKYQHY